jgi:tetratricopeptide (TPR) repeat protein
MKGKILSFILITSINFNSNAQTKDMTLKEAHEKLEDVMEIIDTIFLKTHLIEVEKAYQHDNSTINQIRLGIIYHEVALNFGFFDKIYKGYPQKSLDMLNAALPKLNSDLAIFKPFVLSYKASSLSLLSGETRKLGYLSEAFQLFNEAVANYSSVSYAPEFMRGSVSENLPWFMFKKRSYAKIDFDNIIRKYEADNSYAKAKIMSFTYWAWAMQHQSKKYRTTSISYLDKAIELDPNYNAGRKRAEELKNKMTATK